MTIHVLHAGDGYLYLTRSVAVHDSRIGASESLAAYYIGRGQPPGRWAGSSATRLGVHGTVTEEQMKSLFGEGCHPNANRVAAALRARGVSESRIQEAVRLGRRYPQYRRREDVTGLIRRTYRARERTLGRALSEPEKLGLRQHVLAEAFQRYHGRPPLDPVELDDFASSAPSDGREAVAGYDLVFTPVKSVTALWGIGSEATRRAVFEAHTAAVADALDWLERNACFTRAGACGQAQVDTHGVMAACFDHWDSRAGDPDLHTHVAVSNKVEGVDGTWRSLDGRAIFAAAVSLSERYNTRIEDELRARLGVEFTPRATGADGARRQVREIAGFPAELIELFSKRRHGIEQTYQALVREYRAEHGRAPDKPARWRLYQQATLQDRPDKGPGRTLASLIDGWRREADQTLNQTDAYRATECSVLGRQQAVAAPSPARLAEAVLATVSESRSTWTIHHVRAEAQRQCRPYAVTDRDGCVEAVVAEALAPGRVLRIETPRAVAEPDPLQRASSESVFVEHATTRFTTTAILDAEDRIVAAARRRTRHTVRPETVQRALGRSVRSLTPEQEGLVRDFVSTNRQLLLGIAPAGAGKTTAMKVVVDAWRASGRDVVALAPSASAAGVLHAELGVAADTLAKFDHDQPPIAPGTLILVDEAGLAGTMVLDRLVQRARQADAVVRLVGDDRQLAAVEAGGVLRHLAHEVGAARMTRVVRFADPAEASATIQVRDGDPAAVEFYRRAERITPGTDQTTPEAAYAAWLDDTRAGRDSILLAGSAATVSALNARARADLVVAGAVDVDGVPLRDGNAAGVGDRIVTRRNHRTLLVHGGRDWVKNGDSWRVVATHDDGSLTVVHRRHAGRVQLPADYVAGQVELDYARTVRRAQGMTVDHAHLLVDPGMCREDLYVGLSRARHGTRLYVAVATDPGPAHPPEVAGSAREVLARIIRRSGVEPSAREAVKSAIDENGNLRRMAVEYEYALDVRVGDHYRHAAEALHPGITADPAWPAATHRLHLAEGLGIPAADALRRTEQMGDFAAVRSAAAVTAHRLDLLLQHARTHDPAVEQVPWWLAAPPPARLTTPWDTYLPARYQQITARVDDLATQAHADHPGWLDDLGRPSPHHEAAVRHVVAYRTVYDIHTPDPLGPEPVHPGRQQQAWRAAHAAIQTARNQHDNPDTADRLTLQLTATDAPYLHDTTGPTRDGPTLHL